jgi:hypothetical protein
MSQAEYFFPMMYLAFFYTFVPAKGIKVNQINHFFAKLFFPCAGKCAGRKLYGYGNESKG